MRLMQNLRKAVRRGKNDSGSKWWFVLVRLRVFTGSSAALKICEIVVYVLLYVFCVY